MAVKSVAHTAIDPTIRFETLTIRGVEYKLAFTFNALAEAEAQTGGNVLQCFGRLSNLSAIELRSLLHASLLTAHPDMTVEHAGALVGLGNLPAIYVAIAKAFELSMPEEEKKSEPESIAS
jgi:hypothetical protein